MIFLKFRYFPRLQGARLHIPLSELLFTEADLNDTLLVRVDGLKANEFVDSTHGIRFHLKSAETSLRAANELST